MFLFNSKQYVYILIIYLLLKQDIKKIPIYLSSISIIAISSSFLTDCNINLLLNNEILQLFNVSVRTVLDYCNSKEENISLDILVKKDPWRWQS